MVKKVIIFLLVFLTNINAQSYMSFNYMKFHDKEIVNLLTSISSDMGASNVLVFQTIMQERDMVTFILTDFGNNIHVRMITSGFIYSTVELTNSKIFNYKFIDNTGVSENENKLKNVPSFLDPYKGSDIVMYSSPKQEFFYELGKPVNYVEDKTKMKHRREWVDLIKQELATNLSKFKKETLYKRGVEISSR
ncbi:MAG: hypothetical protein R6W90_15275 [Ignavibacteriaceae bacterium]